MEAAANSARMCKFLSQFRLLDNFSMLHSQLRDSDMLSEAKRLGFVKDWEPPKGCTYRATAICTPRGRLFVKQNA